MSKNLPSDTRGAAIVEPARTPPPSFGEAKNRRQKVRAAGLHPDYWYPVAHSHEIKPGKAIEVKFWRRSFAVFRGADGQLRAIDNRCAHRQLKLTLGEVDKHNQLVCPYHGWCYNGQGQVVHIPHELFGRSMPNFQVPSYAVRERYGLVWLFPGDPNLAQTRALPEIPELTGP